MITSTKRIDVVRALIAIRTTEFYAAEVAAAVALPASTTAAILRQMEAKGELKSRLERYPTGAAKRFYRKVEAPK